MLIPFSGKDIDPEVEFERTINVSPSEKVRELRGRLGVDESTSVKLWKQCRPVEFDETVGDVFEDDDSLTVITDDETREAKEKNIKNNTAGEVRLVILNSRKNEPLFLPVGEKRAVSFCFWNFSNKMELYR